MLTTSVELAVPPFAAQVHRRTGATEPLSSTSPYVVNPGLAKLLQTCPTAGALQPVTLLSTLPTPWRETPLVLTSIVNPPLESLTPGCSRPW